MEGWNSRKKAGGHWVLSFPTCSARLEEHPFEPAIVGLTTLGPSELAHDASNLHLVAAGLSFDRFLDGFGQQQLGGDDSGLVGWRLEPGLDGIAPGVGDLVGLVLAVDGEGEVEGEVVGLTGAVGVDSG